MLSFRRMWLLIRETNGESSRRQCSWPWCCPRCQCMELGHLCARQCINNYVRNAQNMSNDNIVNVCHHKNKHRTSALDWASGMSLVAISRLRSGCHSEIKPACQTNAYPTSNRQRRQQTILAIDFPDSSIWRNRQSSRIQAQL